MNLDELRSVQEAERSKSNLQQLRDSFYEEAGKYVADLKAERDRVADRADDPFSDPEVRRLSDEIETAEEVVEAIYERRMGKLLDEASLAAAGMGTDEEGLTAEERELFHAIVDRIEANKTSVLDIIAGNVEDGGDDDRTGDPDGGKRTVDQGSPATGTGKSDRSGRSRNSGDDRDAGRDPSPGRSVGGDPTSPEGRDSTPADDGSSGGHQPVEPGSPPPDGGAPGADEGVPAAGAMGSGSDDSSADPPDPPAPDEFAGGESGGESRGPTMSDIDDRVTVRITDEVGPILGVDDREYDLERETVVDLPEENAEPLLDSGAAERLD